MSKLKENTGIFFLYLLFFCLLFIKFPLHNSLIGDLDLWFYVWQANDYYQLLFDKANYTQINFPVEDVYKYTDYVWGLASLYIPLRQFTSNDIWIFYFLYVLIFSLNAFSLKLFLESIGINKFSALLLALIFCCNNFLISNIENMNIVVMFPCFFAVTYLHKGLKKGSYVLLFLSALFMFYQQSFSIYLYVFQFFLVAFIILINQFQLKPIGFWLFFTLLFTLPFFVYHDISPAYLLIEPFKTIGILANEEHSLHYFRDFFRVNKGNLIYPAMQDIGNPWKYQARSAFFGISSYLLIVYSFFYFRKQKFAREVKVALLLLLVCAIIAAGPMFDLFGYRIYSPIGWVNLFFPKSILFRHLFRIHLFSILFFFILIGLFLNHHKKRNLIMGVFAILFLIENLPFNYPNNDSFKYITPSKNLTDLTDKLPAKSNLYFLPSCLILEDELHLNKKNNLFKAEMIYGVWKNHIHHNTFNGLLSQNPDDVYENFILTCDLDSTNFKELIHVNNIDYFVIAKEFASKDFMSKKLPIVESKTKFLEENKEFILFEVTQ